ncbi:hypothetical protein FKM82_019751 [Ascaphus truei]
MVTTKPLGSRVLCHHSLPLPTWICQVRFLLRRSRDFRHFTAHLDHIYNQEVYFSSSGHIHNFLSYWERITAASLWKAMAHSLSLL